MPLAYKFVDENFLSSQKHYGVLDYSGPWPKKMYASYKYKQWEPGIHATLFIDDWTFWNVYWDKKLIVLEYSETFDVIKQDRNKIRLSEAIVLREANAEELQWLLDKCIESDEIVSYAKYIAGHTDEMRRLACNNSPSVAWNYASDVEKAPHDDTRIASCEDPYFALRYAIYIDKAPHDLTWKAVKNDEVYRKMYEEKVGILTA